MWSPGGVGVDVNGDGVSDLRVGHFGEVRPDVGMAYGEWLALQWAIQQWVIQEWEEELI